ncbi:MAG: iron-containing alcohol dehydrogenase [Planctomycetes bacterium]|nr:iron-containing alcohol dehydrogenase [Planctomycetota bacterium]
MLEYDFLSPSRIVFGWGRRRELGALAATLGRRAFVVLGSRTLQRNGAWDELAAQLQNAKIAVLLAATISREPEVADVDQLAAHLHEANVGPGDFLLALGGGAALDLAKAGAALATNRHGQSVRDFLEGVGQGLQITEPPLPMLAMPTTGGTGTEATKNAVITVADPPVKKSIRSPLMVPRVVLVDPELSVSVPPETTAWTGLDAITQLIESYICRFARPIPQALAVHGLQLAMPRISEAVRDGTSRPAREAMAHAALLSGLALANSGLGLAHGVAAALGVFAGVPHGLACAMMVPVALEVNRTVAEKPLAELARATLQVTSASDAAAAGAFIAHVAELCAELGVPARLSQVGVRPDQLDALVRGSRGNSMNGNPRQLTDPELRELLEKCL